MTTRERIVNTMAFRPVDRLPMIEWAGWWDKTLDNWRDQGLDGGDLFGHFGLDDHRQFWIHATAPDAPHAPGADCHVTCMEDYERLRPWLFPEAAIARAVAGLTELVEGHVRGDFAVWLTLEGFFWWPRELMGIEAHLYSFYDEPELYHRMCGDLADFHLRVVEAMCAVSVPDFVTFAEDMSYNHGPMLSEASFEEFLRPYYQRVVPELKRRGIKVLVDTDGDVMPMVPWLLRAGMQGILPLERQSGVDAAVLRELYPELIMLGAFDKRVMKQGEAAMRAEFERLLPVMRTGGFIPSVDHQTPPDVSVENYEIYMRLFREYATKGAGR